ncbi:uncharacterized protein [Solanum tuberosum]|uniref:uncharacterized protein n=1 Tax=Solanum tuberosum TaxID=4113 RepID=UPI00073A29DD|nr:PREDICTED: uncharacterized protein LOC107061609 [Solanum tuberosum]
MKKFIVTKFLDYKMIDNKTVVTQVQELQVIIHDLLAEGLIENDVFQVAAIIEKLPPLWKDFKNYLKHKRTEMTIEDLMVRLRIEEDNKAAEKRSCECNLVGNPREWWIDSGASCHVCANKELFALYTPAPSDEKLFMENSIATKVEGTGNVHLKMTSGKVVTLNRVLYVPELRKNLVSILVLTKNGFKCVFVSDKVEVSKNEMYVGKGYLTEGLFKLNVIAVDRNKDFASSYLLESKCLWHEHLGHINNKTLRKLINLNVFA